MKILIYLQNDNSQISDVSYQLISKTKEITKNIENCEITGVLISSQNINEEQFKGIDKLIYIKTPNLKHYSNVEYTNIFYDVIKEEQPDIVFIGATNQGRDLAPRIATKLKTGLTADCTELEIAKDGKLIATRPTFGGSLMAQILCKTKPQMATVRPNVFKQTELTKSETLVIKIIENDTKPTVEVIKTEQKTSSIYDFNGCDVILSGGLGLKTKENFELLKQLADKINAKIGSTRKAVEKGLIDKKYQIGQTGQSVAPKIYFAIGISGAIQHFAGIEKSDKIVAINPDKNAPIHENADYSIFMDGQKFITDWLKDF